MKKFKMFLSYFIIAAMILQIIPMKTLAAQDNNYVATSKVEATSPTSEWYNDSIISTSTDPLVINGSNISIDGNIHTNGNFEFSGSRLDLQGECEASGAIKVKGSKINIVSKEEKSATLNIPNFYDVVMDNIKSDSQIIDGDKKYSGSTVNIDKSIIINGNLSFSSSEFNGKGYIVADKNITFNVSSFNKNQNQKLYLSSGNGNIAINSSNIIFDGIIYAPNGTVTFNTSSLTLKGKIIARKVIFKGSFLSVKNDYDKDLLYENDLLKDSDNDGIPDKYVQDVLIPGMLNQGIPLNQSITSQDFDGDGLDNLEEYKLGTNPFSKDTDEDGLSDYDELYKYHTDPNKYDTDGDGMGDGIEVKNGLNPLIKDTDGNGLIDSQEVINEILPDYAYKNIDIQKSLVVPNLVIKGCGDYSKQLDINDVSDNKTFASIHSIVGHPFEFVHNDNLKFESSQLSFKISDAVLQKHKLNNLKIAWYDTENNKINLLDTQIDDVNKTISTTINHFSNYFVIDSSDYYYDIDVLNANSKIDTGKADVVFTIDTTGSMWSSIYNVKSNINAVVDKLKADHVDVRLGLVGFKDITCDGLYSTKDYGWFTNVDDFKSAVNALYADGGGDWEESDVDGIEVSREKDFRNSVNKYIILLTDAPYKNGTKDNPNMTMDSEIVLLKNDKISVSVITDVGDSSVKDVYEPLYTQTNGIIADIYGDFVAVLQPLIEKMSNISNQGAWIRLSNGSIVHLDKDPALGDYSVDTDKDGIPDLVELSQEVQDSYIDSLSNATRNYKCWTFRSNPAVKDTDGDGIDDGKDINPIKYDICIKENTDDYILFNNGDKWLKFGKDIYGFMHDLKQTTLNIRTQGDYEAFLKSDLYKGLQRLLENRKLKLNQEEILTISLLDINGIRDYFTFSDSTLVNNTFKILTGQKIKYYKYRFLIGWEYQGETPIERNWTDFFTGDIRTNAEATLTEYLNTDLLQLLTDVVFAGVIVGATYLVASQVVLLSEGIATFGAWNAFTMYTNGGSGFLQEALDSQEETDIVYHAVTSGGVAQSVIDGINPKYFNPTSRFGGGFYVGNDGDTIVKELEEHGNIASYAIRFDMDLTNQKVLDLTDSTIAEKWGFETGVTSTEACQEIGIKARDIGYTVIKFQSYRGEGINYVIYDNFTDILTVQMVTPIQ